MKSSRLVLFAARWALMSGLAGTVFTLLVFIEGHDATASGKQGMLLAAAALLSIAFILAPFVRWAFAGPRPEKTLRSENKTLLDELRERAEADDAATIASAVEPTHVSQSPATVVSRLLIGLYVVFGIALIVVLLSM